MSEWKIVFKEKEHQKMREGELITKRYLLPLTGIPKGKTVHNATFEKDIDKWEDFTVFIMYYYTDKTNRHVYIFRTKEGA